MIDNFPAFADLVHAQFKDMQSEGELHETEVEQIFQTYLEAFPEGTNPLFKERTEHDCVCCKQFIRRIGNVIQITDDEIVTVWDTAAQEAPYPYNEVATLLQAQVLDSRIRGIFRSTERSYGKETTVSLSELGTTVRYNHFFSGDLQLRFVSGTQADAMKGRALTQFNTAKRGLTELTLDALDTVLDLINADTLYRGEEFLQKVTDFRVTLEEFNRAPREDQTVFLWQNATPEIAGFRNSVIGTLAQDISTGVDLERAVASFESKVAPHNYKRPSSVITPRMISNAVDQLKKMDLEPALERRLARVEDVSVQDVLWVDSTVKPLMKGGIEGALLAEVERQRVDAPPKEKDLVPVTIDQLVEDVMPKATKLEVLFENRHRGRLMSLTAPVHPEPKQLFQWDNDFAWSYNGNITDSVKQRVKNAGGNIDAELRISLSWFNTDDLDLHLVLPRGEQIYYSNKINGGGRLDVDMNVTDYVRDAVENISFARKPPDGTYKIVVNNFTKRESIDVGFNIEVECAGQVSNFSYMKPVRKMVPVATLQVKDGNIVDVQVSPDITASAHQQEVWGISTEQYQPVSMVTHSPNFWGDNQKGNKHVFFVIKDAKVDAPVRGIYNEFLHPRLTEHRKVFEVIGSKTMCEPSTDQLSGLGFSSTQKEDFTVKVTSGKKVTHYKVTN